MSYVITPNMNLLVPTVGTEAGPQYAQDINNSLNLIDGHNHSPGFGVQITPAGMNINQALAFNNNPALSLSYLSLEVLGSPSTAIQSISSSPAANINELWYTDNNGISTQITSNGQVNVTASSITGVTYSAGSFIFNTISGGSATTIPANLDAGSVIIRPTISGTTYGVELEPPGSISSEYAIILPIKPVTNPAFLTLDTSGNMLTNISTVGGITGSMIGTATITTNNVASNTLVSSNISSSAGITPNQLSTTSSWYAQSSSSGSFILAGNSGFSVVTNLHNIAPASSTSTRPMFISFQGGYVGVTYNTSGTFATATFNIKATDGTSTYTVASYFMEIARNGGSSIGNTLFLPSCILNCIDFTHQTLGTYYLEVNCTGDSGTADVYVNSVVMTTYQV